MQIDGLLNLLASTRNPAVFILVIILILLLISGIVSKAAADYGGALGGIARLIRRHKREAMEADEKSNAARLDRLEATIARLEQEITRLQEKDHRHHEYQIYVAGYWRQLEFWAIEQGVKLPPPPMLTYPEWKLANYPSK